MGLLKGQNEIMNDGDCLQVLNDIFTKQLQECVNYIEDIINTPRTGILKYGTNDVGRCIEKAVSYIGYESTHVKLYDFVNHYGLSISDIDKLHNKYFIESYSPYDIYINDEQSITINYENTVDYLSKQYKITDVLGSNDLTLTEYQNWAYLVNAFRSFDIVFNQEFIEMQKEFLTNSLNKFYGIQY